MFRTPDGIAVTLNQADLLHHNKERPSEVRAKKHTSINTPIYYTECLDKQFVFFAAVVVFFFFVFFAFVFFFLRHFILTSFSEVSYLDVVFIFITNLPFLLFYLLSFFHLYFLILSELESRET